MYPQAKRHQSSLLFTSMAILTSSSAAQHSRMEDWAFKLNLTQQCFCSVLTKIITSKVLFPRRYCIGKKRDYSSDNKFAELT